MTSREVKQRLFDGVVSELFSACTLGRRSEAEARLRELARMIGMGGDEGGISEVETALRAWGVRLPPNEADLREMMRQNRELQNDAVTAGLIF